MHQEERIGPGVILSARAHDLHRRNAMSTSKLLGAVAILSSLYATPVLAQAVVQEPGYCAFFYPNANCQNKGPGSPYGNYRRPAAQGNDWSSGETVGVAPKRSRALRYGSAAPRVQECGDCYQLAGEINPTRDGARDRRASSCDFRTSSTCTSSLWRALVALRK